MFIQFEGVYMNSDVWVNGQHVGNWPYGYTTFEYDVTPFMVQSGNNTVAVRVNNTGVTSRWYSGSGIYRHTWLSEKDSIYIPLWGVQVPIPTWFIIL